jgi:GNAT superfamily N-acetyltransferase
MVASDAAPPLVRLAPADALGVLPLSIAAGWNQVAADWRLMLGLGRAFGIKDGGEWIGSALALPLGPAVWWISMVLVREGRRRQGHGTRLLLRCIAEVAASGAAVGLDATALGRPLYLALGFRDCCEVSRWQGATPPEAAAPAPGIGVRPVTGADLERIADYDAARSGFRRGAVLTDLWARAPALALVAHAGNGEIAGFVLGRDGHRATHIGPIIAEDEGTGLALLGAAASRIRDGFIIDVPDEHAGLRRSLAAAGAAPARSYMRMRKGSARTAPGQRHLFAIAGPELA